jgi:hypothetical protein
LTYIPEVSNERDCTNAIYFVSFLCQFTCRNPNFGRRIRVFLLFFIAICLAKAFNLCGRSKIHWCSTMSIFLAIHDCKVNMFASFQRLPRVVTLRAYLLPHFFLPKSSNLWQREKVSHNLACKDILPRHDGHMACGINPYLDEKFGTPKLRHETRC